MIDGKKLIQAVKELRDAMGVNQVTFSVKLGKSLSMIQRYERGENIPARDLALMAGFSRAARRPDLAAIFKSAVLELLGAEVINLVREDEADGVAEQKATGNGPVNKRKLSA